MNANLPPSHPSVDFYDSDYPGIGTTAIAQNLDDKLEHQGIAHDIGRYLELARESAGPVLELCCGTGRVAIPLARAGVSLVAVDISEAMLERFRAKLALEDPAVRSRIELARQDATQLALECRQFGLALLPFNSLMLIADRRRQQQVLAGAASYLRAGGRLVVDLMNPLALPLKGDPVPTPFLSRRHAGRDRPYTRFAALGAVDADQRQNLFGWYDEIDAEGLVRRTPYSMWWRVIFRAELELMLESAGLAVESVEGGHRHETFTPQAAKLFAIARKPG